MNYQEMIRELAVPVAPSGFETPVIDRLETLAREKGAQTSRTALGNLIAHRPGTGRKIALVAHVDSKGFVVLDKGENGFCRIGELGHTALASVIGAPVRFANGARGIIGCDGGAKAECKVTDLFINLTCGSVDLGDVCVVDLPGYADGNLIISPALESRAGAAILLDVLARTDSDADLYVVFSVQHELGERGAASALFDIQPDAVIVCECLPASDIPGASLKCSVKLGEGPVLPVKIGRGAANPALIEKLEKAGAYPVQRAVYPDGLSDMTPIQVSGIGMYTCTVGIPVRTYGAMSMANIPDIQNTAELLLKAVKTL